MRDVQSESVKKRRGEKYRREEWSREEKISTE